MANSDALDDNRYDDITFYDDHIYDTFWTGRDYEHLSEIIALKKLKGHRHYDVVLDYGGGYGRLTPLLAAYADRTILADPSQQQLSLAQSRLETKQNIETLLLKENGKIPLQNNSVDLIVMVRVSHHLTHPKLNFMEMHRILKSNGRAIIEIANSAHILNRLRYARQFKTVPEQPIRIGTVSNGVLEDVPFLNHNIKTIEQDLKDCHFSIIEKLSVSNLRNSYLKNHIRLDHLIAFESRLQKSLSYINFGPSIFLLVQKDKPS